MFSNCLLEIKSLQDDGIFEGYASVFNVIDDVEDIILPGAFKELDLKKIKVLWQHNYELPIGKVLNIYEDQKGLYVKVQLVLAVQQAQDAYNLLKSGAINGLSIGYVPLIKKTEDGVRKIFKIDLWEVSLVTFPANNFARVVSSKSLYSVFQKAYSNLQNLIASSGIN